MTTWNIDHKHTPAPPSLAEQIENGVALGGLLGCLCLSVWLLLIGMGLL